MESSDVIAVCNTFNKENATPDEIAEFGANLFRIMYGGKVSDELSHLRKLKSSEKNATCKTG